MELLENHWQAQPSVQTRPAEPSSAVDRVLIIGYRKKKKESRFESGAEIPAPVSILLGLYFTKTVSDADLGRAERVLFSRDAAALLNPGQ
jgi:hypothetical protein